MDKDVLSQQSIENIIRYNNTNIDIFQNVGSFVLDVNRSIPFTDSFEKRQLENEAAFVIQNKNSMVFYSIIEGHPNLNRTAFELKKTFRETHNKSKPSIEEIEKAKMVLIKNTYKKEFEDLLNHINDPKFEENMKNNPQFLKYILNHNLLCYIPEKGKILNNYLKYLCPNYTQSLNNTHQYQEEDYEGNDGEEDEEVEELYESDDN